MAEQFDIFGDVSEQSKKIVNKAKRNWENAFQRWSDMQAQDETSSQGKCGHSLICNWCKDNHYGKPCVRALNAMCREKRITIDYSKREFEKRQCKVKMKR